ncbi:MAG: hypothetical protein K2M01_08380 [Paramuribaculum sp.]|nr:hypothetical protein [Paramuribaculum sp.]
MTARSPLLRDGSRATLPSSLSSAVYPHIISPPSLLLCAVPARKRPHSAPCSQKIKKKHK